jgi:putative transposase
MLRITPTDDDRDALQRLRRDPTLTPLERDHVEMLWLAAAGWSAPRIARHLGRCAATVRTLLKRFPTDGAAGVRCRQPGPPPDSARRAQVTAALDGLLAEPRTWTAAQLSGALAEQDIGLSPRQTRKYLQGVAAWRRTVRSLHHKQDPAKVATAKRHLGVLEKRGRRASSRVASLMSAASAPASR